MNTRIILRTHTNSVQYNVHNTERSLIPDVNVNCVKLITDALTSGALQVASRENTAGRQRTILAHTGHVAGERVDPAGEVRDAHGGHDGDPGVVDHLPRVRVRARNLHEDGREYQRAHHHQQKHPPKTYRYRYNKSTLAFELLYNTSTRRSRVARVQAGVEVHRTHPLCTSSCRRSPRRRRALRWP